MSKITIVGMGALGVLYGDMILKNMGEESFTFLADEERIARYRREGVFCNGKKCDFPMSAEPSPTELLIFAVKGTGLHEAMELAAGAVGSDTVIISLLNGISSEELLAERFGAGKVVHCIAQGMDAVKLGNKLSYEHAGELRIGTPDPSGQPLVDRVAYILAKAGIPYVKEEDILHRLWGKWMLNVGVNQVVMMEEGTYGTVQKPGKARDMMYAAMEEVVALSQKAGTGVTREDLDGYVALLDSLNPDGMPSMRQDGLAHRYSEVELFSGTVLKKAREYGVETPINRLLYDRIKEMEAEY